MAMYDRETETIRLTLRYLLLEDDQDAIFLHLESIFEQCDFPKTVEIILRDALRKLRKSGCVDAEVLDTLLLAYEKMSGHKYVEEYISERNQLIKANQPDTFFEPVIPCIYVRQGGVIDCQ